MKHRVWFGLAAVNFVQCRGIWLWSEWGLQAGASLFLDSLMRLVCIQEATAQGIGAWDLAGDKAVFGGACASHGPHCRCAWKGSGRDASKTPRGILIGTSLGRKFHLLCSPSGPFDKDLLLIVMLLGSVLANPGTPLFLMSIQLPFKTFQPPC